MGMTKEIVLRGQVLGAGKEPLVCTPLVAKDEAALLRELAAVCAKNPDLIEWRVDFFGAIADIPHVAAVARKVRENAQGIPIIFTRRSTREGGEATGMSEDAVLALYEAVCDTGCVDFVDVELSSEPAHFQSARAAAKRSGTLLIASFHNFQQTPPAEEIVAKFVAAETAGADIAKVAVMPRAIEDVLTLLSATLEGNRKISLPIISMSMGGYGSLTRLFGWAYGSAVSFAVGDKASAPGQVPIADLRLVLDVVQRAFSGGK